MDIKVILVKNVYFIQTSSKVCGRQVWFLFQWDLVIMELARFWSIVQVYKLRTNLFYRPSISIKQKQVSHLCNGVYSVWTDGASNRWSLYFQTGCVLYSMRRIHAYWYSSLPLGLVLWKHYIWVWYQIVTNWLSLALASQEIPLNEYCTLCFNRIHPPFSLLGSHIP